MKTADGWFDTEDDHRYVAALFEALGPDCSAEEAIRWSRAHPHPDDREG